MAFVFKAQRKYHIQSGVGPAHYQLSRDLFQPRQKKQTKLRKLPEKIITFDKFNGPGPGKYSIPSDFKTKKVIYENQQVGIIVQQQQNQSSSFKGSEKRKWFQPNTLTPGPGAQYHKIISNPEPPTNFQYPQQIQKSKISALQQSIRLNKYQSIPSIPSNIHQKGYYYQNPNSNKLELFQIDVGYTGKQNDSVGPGSYDTQQKIKKNKLKELSSFKSGVKRQVFKLNHDSVGPGQYEHLSQFNNKNKFAQSKSDKNLSRYKLKQSTLKSTTLQVSFQDEEEEEYNECTPGPGYYNTSQFLCKPKAYNKSKIKKLALNRTKVLQKLKGNKQVGPGQYDIQNTNQKKQQVQRANKVYRNGVGFGSSDTKFENQSGVEYPGSGYYYPRGSIQDKLIQKLQRGYRGRFGVSVKRLQQVPKYIGPDYLDNNHNGIIQNLSRNYKFVFQSGVQKLMPVSNKNPSPCQYKIVNNNIENSLKQRSRQYDDIQIPCIPFNNHEQRFKPLIKEEESTFSQQGNQPPKNNLNEYYFNGQSKSPFNSTQNRFYQKKSSSPGPGAYFIYDNKPLIKPSFNIQFTKL